MKKSSSSKTTKTVHRSSVSGKFVTKGFAKSNPSRTERERVRTGH